MSECHFMDIHNRGFKVSLATQSPDEQAVILIAEAELVPLRPLSIGFFFVLAVQVY